MHLGTDIQLGLSTEYVNSHIRNSSGYKNSQFIEIYKVFLNQIRSIFFVLLLLSAVLSFYLGNHTDAWIFSILNILNIGIGFSQEYRASKASKALEKLIEHNVTVLRDGKKKKIQSKDVIDGDIVYLSPGNVFVADMLVREARDSFVDESIRTGESEPREVFVGDTIYAGTSLASGTIIAEVISIGEETTLAQYGKKINHIQKDNNFSDFIKSVSKYILLITLTCLALVAVYAVYFQSKYSGSDFILFAISMLVGVVPESLSLIITLILSREALALSKEGVIVKNLSALQQLGSIKYLLTDKTGTLTENSIRMTEVKSVSGMWPALASVAVAEYERTPMDTAFDTAIESKITTEITPDTNVYYLRPRKALCTPFSNKVGYARFEFDDMIVCRGQFQAVLDITNNLMQSQKDELLSAYTDFESRGLRVIAYASASINNKELGIDYQDAGVQDFIFNGFAVFEDPLKSDASHSYLATEGLGIRVKILTGDSVLVSKYVARELDSKFDETYVEELGSGSVKAYTSQEVERDRVYARCMPEQKFDLINKHLVYGAVGFMGEGINDALALRRADVGIAVTNASEVARQSADILLTEKSLNPVIRAIQLSRKAYAHISTYLLCTLTGNIGTLLSLTLVAMFWTDLPMLPIQILLNNLLTDVPLIMLVTDHLAKTDYKNPINHSAREFFKTMFIFGIISSIFDMAYFFLFKDQSLETLRTGWFIFSVLCELVLVFSLRSKLSIFKAPKLSLPLSVAMILSAAMALACIYMPMLGSKLSLVSLSINSLVTIVGLVVLYIVINEGYKKMFRMSTGEKMVSDK